LGLAVAAVSPFVYHTKGRGESMTWVNASKISDKLVNVFSDNRVMPSEWKFAVPIYLVQQPLPVVINIKNFIDGMQHNIELYGVEIPPDRLAHDPYSKDYLLK
jgi:hypothetical protein